MDFVSKSRGTGRPMSEDEVRTFMRYQFTRYLMAKAGLKSKYTTRSDEPVQNVSDIDVLINQVALKENRDFMAAVMGEDPPVTSKYFYVGNLRFRGRHGSSA